MGDDKAAGSRFGSRERNVGVPFDGAALAQGQRLSQYAIYAGHIVHSLEFLRHFSGNIGVGAVAVDDRSEETHRADPEHRDAGSAQPRACPEADRTTHEAAHAQVKPEDKQYQSHQDRRPVSVRNGLVGSQSQNRPVHLGRKAERPGNEVGPDAGQGQREDRH